MLRIFLSYASEDYEFVESYYNKLKNLGLKPWIDKKDIIPGMNWENSIWSAVKQSDLVVVFLSKNSASKRGFIQREIREALKLWEEKLDNDIYLIPVRLDNCEVPDKLNKFQYTNLFEEDGWDKLLESLNYAAKSLNIETISSPKPLEIITKKYTEEKTELLSYNIKCEYPQILGDKNFDEINQIISGFIYENIQSFRKPALETITDKKSKTIFGDTAMQEELNIQYELSFLSEKLISVSFNLWSFSLGAAHHSGYQRTFNFEINPTLHIQLEDLFKSESNYLEFLSSYCIKELCKELVDDLIGGNDATVSWVKRGASPKIENFKNFILSENSLKILFDVYQVGCFAEGHKSVEIPLVKLKDIAESNSTIYRLLETV